jgi:hypothetical protein
MRTMAAVRARFRRVDAYLHRSDGGAADQLFDPMSGRCMTVPLWTLVIYVGHTAAGTFIVHLAIQSGRLTKILQFPQTHIW